MKTESRGVSLCFFVLFGENAEIFELFEKENEKNKKYAEKSVYVNNG